MSSDSERDRRLDNFYRTFSKNIDDAIAEQDKELKQRYSQEFTDRMNQAEEYAKKGIILRLGNIIFMLK
jgi:ribosomal protein S20